MNLSGPEDVSYFKQSRDIDENEIINKQTDEDEEFEDVYYASNTFKEKLSSNGNFKVN